MQHQTLNPDDAAESIEAIRCVLARTTRYTHISWLGITWSGAVGAVAAGGAWLADISPATEPGSFLLLWGVALLLALSGGLLTSARKARLACEPLLGRKLQIVSLGFLPSLVAAAVVTCLLVEMESVTLAPGFWALFYALGILAAAHVLDWDLQVTAWVFLVASAISFFLLRDSPHLAMLLSFGAIHLVLGAFRFHQEHSCPAV